MKNTNDVDPAPLERLVRLIRRIHELVSDDLATGNVRGDLSHWTIEAETRDVLSELDATNTPQGDNSPWSGQSGDGW